MSTRGRLSTVDTMDAHSLAIVREKKRSSTAYSDSFWATHETVGHVMWHPDSPPLIELTDPDGHGSPRLTIDEAEQVIRDYKEARKRRGN